MTVEEVCLALLYSLLRILELNCHKQVCLWCCRPFAQAQFFSCLIPVSTRDVLVGLFDAVTIKVPWTLYLRCLCSDLLF